MCNVTGKKIEMAYVKWFKLGINQWDSKTEMFKVKKSMPGDYGVIEIGSIKRGAHLVLCFKGFEMPMAKLDLKPSLDEYSDFWINNWIDEHKYNTICIENEKWVEP